jgi:DNA-binding transcriptional ArsR family regulator
VRRRGRLDRRCALDIIVKQVPNQSAALDLVFQALADPTRRVMVERLTRGPASVSELAKPFAMSLPAVVQHLQVLEASGLVRSEKSGRVRTCRIEPAVLRTAEQWIAERRTGWERRLDRLGEILAEDPEDARR